MGTLLRVADVVDEMGEIESDEAPQDFAGAINIHDGDGHSWSAPVDDDPDRLTMFRAAGCC
jgi:hypothetical protein